MKTIEGPMPEDKIVHDSVARTITMTLMYQNRKKVGPRPWDIMMRYFPFDFTITGWKFAYPLVSCTSLTFSVKTKHSLKNLYATVDDWIWYDIDDMGSSTATGLVGGPPPAQTSLTYECQLGSAICGDNRRLNGGKYSV